MRARLIEALEDGPGTAEELAIELESTRNRVHAAMGHLRRDGVVSIQGYIPTPHGRPQCIYGLKS